MVPRNAMTRNASQGPRTGPPIPSRALPADSPPVAPSRARVAHTPCAPSQSPSAGQPAPPPARAPGIASRTSPRAMPGSCARARRSIARRDAALRDAARADAPPALPGTPTRDPRQLAAREPDAAPAPASTSQASHDAEPRARSSPSSFAPPSNAPRRGPPRASSQHRQGYRMTADSYRIDCRPGPSFERSGSRPRCTRIGELSPVRASLGRRCPHFRPLERPTSA